MSVDVQKDWKFTAIRQLDLVTLKKTKRTYHNFPVAKKTLNPTKQGHQRVSNNARIPRNIPEQHTIRDFCLCHPGHSQGHQQAHIYHQKGFLSEPLFCHFHTPVAGELCAEPFDHQLARTSSRKLGFRLEKIPNAGEQVESQWSLVANHHLYNLLQMSKMIPSNVGNNSPSPARSWSPWSNVAVASLCLISKKQRTPEGALRSSESLRKRTTLKRDRLVLLKRCGADDTPPMLAKPTENLKFTCKCVNAGVLSAWICANQPCERAKSDVTHTLNLGRVCSRWNDTSSFFIKWLWKCTSCKKDLHYGKDRDQNLVESRPPTEKLLNVLNSLWNDNISFWWK